MVSLAISKWMAKRMTGLRLLNYKTMILSVGGSILSNNKLSLQALACQKWPPKIRQRQMH